jgi:hypothetical protein
LAAAGFRTTVDHRTLEAQAADAVARGDVQSAARLSRLPEQHEGKTATALARRGAPSDRREANRATKADNVELAKVAHSQVPLVRSTASVKWRGSLHRTGAATGSRWRMVRADTAAYRRSRSAPVRMPPSARRNTRILRESYIQMLTRLGEEQRRAIEHLLRVWQWREREEAALRKRLALDGRLRRLVWHAYATHLAADRLERVMQETDGRRRAGEATARTSVPSSLPGEPSGGTYPKRLIVNTAAPGGPLVPSSAPAPQARMPSRREWAERRRQQRRWAQATVSPSRPQATPADPIDEQARQARARANASVMAVGVRWDRADATVPRGPVGPSHGDQPNASAGRTGQRRP